MTENPGRLRTLLDGTLTGEPPLLDLVPGAVTGFEHRRRRNRLAGGASLAVLALAAGAYGLVPGGSARGGGVPPANGTAGGSPAAVHRTPGDFGIPGLFDHPGTPQEQCAKAGLTKDPESRVKSLADAHAYCERVLTQLRALFPEDVVVLQPLVVDFGQPQWSAKLVTTPDGGVVPGFADAYQKAAEDKANVAYDYTSFAFTGSHGSGTITYQTTDPDQKYPAEPGGDVPLGDGTAAHLKRYESGSISLTGVDHDGLRYDLVVSGVMPVYSAVGSTLEPSVRGDGKDHELFPDGHVAIDTGHGATVVPNPYTTADLKQLLRGKDLGAMIKAIGPDIFATPLPQ